MEIIIGGSGSGKSAYAEDCVIKSKIQNRIYLATMYPFGREGKNRIERHIKMRNGKHFQTIEKYTNIGDTDIPPNSIVLLECMSNLVANELFQTGGTGKEIVSRIIKGIDELEKKTEKLIIVTNDVFSDGIIYDIETVEYLSVLGKVNKILGEKASQIEEVVYGIPVLIKGEKQ